MYTWPGPVNRKLNPPTALLSEAEPLSARFRRLCRTWGRTWVAGLALLFCCPPFSAGQEPVQTRQACALLTLELIPDSAHVRLNGEYLDSRVWLLALPPGTHAIEAGSPGYRGQNQRVDLASGERRTLVLRLEPAPGR